MPAIKPYPTHYENDEWHAPDVFFVPGISLPSNKAAAFLGISRDMLIRYADDLGLTVLRRPYTAWRYFLVSELKQLKQAINTLSRDDLVESKGIRKEITAFNKRKKKRRR